MNSCGCHDPIVWGHICGQSGMPPPGWPNHWRILPDLTNPTPRPPPGQ